MIIKAANGLLKRIGFVIGKIEKEVPVDISQDAGFMEIYRKCKPFTMTSVERMYTLYNAIIYTLRNEIGGDFVECGVWRGGSSMLIALTLLKHGVSDRPIYLYDTYEGMSDPSEQDVAQSGQAARELLKQQDKADPSSIWCYSSIEEVKRNLQSTGYPSSNLHFVKGKVEDTLHNVYPQKIALLRLDTDWYESTRKELEVLYPLLERKGVMIIDDFGFWEGAKKAVIEYFSVQEASPYLHRIDFTGRLIVKP